LFICVVFVCVCVLVTAGRSYYRHNSHHLICGIHCGYTKPQSSQKSERDGHCPRSSPEMPGESAFQVHFLEQTHPVRSNRYRGCRQIADDMSRVRNRPSRHLSRIRRNLCETDNSTKCPDLLKEAQSISEIGE